MRKQIEENCQPRQAHQVRLGNRSNLSAKLIDDVLDHLANKRGGLAVLHSAAKKARSNCARHAARALREKRRAVGPVDFATCHSQSCRRRSSGTAANAGSYGPRR
jgi:hypothetical protein